jgi:dipeptidyl aminopeptidase/acylaminoacyl peptidase
MVVKRSIVIVTYLAFLTRSAIAAGIPESRTVYFESSGHQVAADLVRPAQPERHPAILLLYGRGGLSFYGPSFVRRAQKLAGAGFAVLTPHYFDASASPDAPEVTEVRFETWRKALDDALAFAAKLPDIDPKRIAVVGVSLGGFLAAVETVQDDRIAALVSESSGVSTWFPPHPTRMAPLMIVHSREDATVPLSNAEQLAEIARSFRVEPEFALYDGRQHVLTGDSARSADDRIMDFLTRILRRSGP